MHESLHKRRLVRHPDYSCLQDGFFRFLLPNNGCFYRKHIRAISVPCLMGFDLPFVAPQEKALSYRTLCLQAAISVWGLPNAPSDSQA